MYVRQDVRVFVRVLHMLKLSRFFPPRLEDYVLNVKNLIYQIVIERHGFVSVEEVGKKRWTKFGGRYVFFYSDLTSFRKHPEQKASANRLSVGKKDKTKRFSHLYEQWRRNYALGHFGRLSVQTWSNI